MNLINLFTREPTRHFIGGRFVASASGREFSNLNPATGASLPEVALGGTDEIDLAVLTCQRALRDSRWSLISVAERAKVLMRLAALIEEHLPELALLETIDTGKPISESMHGDVPRAAKNIRFFAELATHLPNECYLGEDRSKHVTYRESIGVVGLITPWNLPLYLATWKLAPALIQGNAVILKPAELTPLTASALASLSVKAGIPSGIFNVVHGFGPSSAGEALVAHPDVKAISFTGETTTGSVIMRGAAPHLKKLSFELGGKGATLIFADADLDTACRTAVQAAFRNQGQICLAGSRLLVEQSVANKVIERITSLAKQIKIGDPQLKETQMGSLISTAHRERVAGYVNLAREKGHTIHTGGFCPEDLVGGAFYAPTIISGMPVESCLIQEEIFGPVLSVQTFTSVAEAIELCNATPYGLSASVWSQNPQTLHQVSRELQMGLVWQNCWFVRELHTAFGGMKRSGIGREGGRYSLEFFSELKTISTMN